MASISVKSVGSRDWWTYYADDEPRGPVDTLLRLLEQGVISRRKALEVLAWRLHSYYYYTREAPDVPWDEVNWSSDGEEDKP